VRDVNHPLLTLTERSHRIAEFILHGSDDVEQLGETLIGPFFIQRWIECASSSSKAYKRTPPNCKGARLRKRSPWRIAKAYVPTMTALRS